MSERVLQAMLELRSFLFEAVYENSVATAEFKKASGILGGLWEKVRERPGRVPRPAHDRAGRARRRRPRLHRRHDRPLRRPALRAALHSEALGHRLTADVDLYTGASPILRLTLLFLSAAAR